MGMPIKFYDTCALLNTMQGAFRDDEKFLISSITLKELENIKTSSHKDYEVKYRARRIIRLLKEKPDSYEIVLFQNEWLKDILNSAFLPDTDDSKIIMSAFKKSEEGADLIFVTDDLICEKLAQALGVATACNDCPDEDEEYEGFRELVFSDEDFADFYENILYSKENHLNMINNEYLILKDDTGSIQDSYKWVNGKGFRELEFLKFRSKMFGEIKPRDVYQKAAMDALKNNKLTILRGHAGTGKSFLALTYLFQCLEHGEIDKIVVFCNTVPTAGAVELGYYSGSKDEKLLDSQIGNFLVSKFGNRTAVEAMIEDETLVLLPMSDIRGFDTTGTRTGVYITEAQNLNVELMKLALQRIDDKSFCILDGDDSTQVDLAIYGGKNNGMRRTSDVFKGQKFYGEVKLQTIYRGEIARIADLM